MVIDKSIKEIALVKTLYEVPYRVRMYLLAKRIYRRELKSMTEEDVQRIRRYKNIHNGKRCFIVLTGPSLTEEDLECIKDEICFTVNSGYKAYGIKGWKPRYYVTMDGNEVAQEMLLEVLNGDYSFGGIFTDFSNPIMNDKLIKLPSDASLLFRMHSILNKLARRIWTTGIISNDISKVIYSGKTVLCAAIQIAVYMGFKEIYLLGADFNYSGSRTHSKLTAEEIKNKEWDKKRTESEMLVQIADFSKDAKKKDIHIYNATRGGDLECFKRVRPEEVFNHG